MSRVCVLTAGHLSTCPRMLKAAEALDEAGHEVRVVSTNFEAWATVADRALRARLRVDWSVVDYSRASANSMRVRAGVRYRVSRAVGNAIGPDKLPVAWLACAINRVALELIRAAAAKPADLIYSGGNALLPTALAAASLRAPYAVDLEDFHSGEQAETTPEGRFANRLAEAAEKIVFRGAAFLTAASEAIAGRYAEKYGLRPLVINNTFRLPSASPDFSGNGLPLRLYWFSQTIGPRRGLEEAVRAAGLAKVGCELHLRGKAIPGYMEGLQRLARGCAPNLAVVHHAPECPDRMIELCRGFDVGLALEPGCNLNNRLALSNKTFTYILAGLAVVFTDTPGQRTLAHDLGAAAWLYSPGDVEQFASGLKLWAENRDQSLAARKAAWSAACRRWHWKHPEEEGALLRAVQTVLSR